MNVIIFILVVLLFPNDISGQNIPTILNNNYSASNLYSIVNQWAANFDPDFIVSVWSNMSGVEGLSNQQNCLAGLNRITTAFQNNDTAASRYFDSWGRPRAAILRGDVSYWGSYYECIDLKDTSINETDYCRFHLLAKVNFTVIPLEVGLCFPSVCSVSDFNMILNSYLVQVSKRVNSSGLFPMSVQFTVDPNTPPLCPWRDLEYDAGTIVVLVVCGILFILVLLGSLVDGLSWYYEEWWIKPNSSSVTAGIKNDQSLSINKTDIGTIQHVKRIKEFLFCFSLYKTFPEISSAHHPSGAITCINGIRVISMIWIIVSHIAHFMLSFEVAKNPLYSFSHSYTRFTFQVISSGHKAVDTFFLLSGLLLTYLALRDMERRKGKLPLVVIYIFRYVRLSPLYYFALFFWFKILPHMGHGPNWYFPSHHNCDQYWWTNILYINNFYPRELFKSCFSITWYLAVDMQFFIFSPIFLYLLYHHWPIGVAALLGTLCASWTATGIIAGVNDYQANIIKESVQGRSTFQYNNLLRDIYDVPYCRAGAYLVGMLLGFIFHKKWEPPKGLKIRVPFYSILWIMGIFCSLTPVYGLYHSFHGYTLSTFENVTYLMLAPTGFSVGVACIIYVCHYGYGFIVNSILSWKFWIPLSRLVYAMYLTHLQVLAYFFRGIHSRAYHSDYYGIMWFVAVLAWTCVFTLLAATFVEFPFLNLVKFVFKLCGLERRRQVPKRQE